MEVQKRTVKHHKQYLLARNLAIIKFFLFFNAFTTNKLSANAACFTGFVNAVFALAVLSFIGFLSCGCDCSEWTFVSYKLFSIQQVLHEALQITTKDTVAVRFLTQLPTHINVSIDRSQI